MYGRMGSLSRTRSVGLGQTLEKIQKLDKTIVKEVVRECDALSEIVSTGLGELALHSFSQIHKTEPYDAVLEEFKWLQSLSPESMKSIADILPPPESGTSDKFKSDSMVQPSLVT